MMTRKQATIAYIFFALVSIFIYISRELSGENAKDAERIKTHRDSLK